MIYRLLELKVRIWVLFAYSFLSKKYGITPRYRIHFGKIDIPGVPAQCSVNCDVHNLYFDLEKIKESFIKYIKLIAIHEVVHLMVNKVHHFKGEYGKDDIAGGHNELFLEMMQSMRNCFTEEEWQLHKTRHIKQFLEHTPSIAKMGDLPKTIVLTSRN